MCRETVAHQIELVGRAVGQPVRTTPNYKVTFQALTIKTVIDAHGGVVDALRVPMVDCVAAAARPGGGIAYLDRLATAQRDYEPLMVKAIAQKGAARRVTFAAPPSVARRGGQVEVALEIKGDRVRVQTQATDAFAAAAAALRTNPTTPAETHLEVVVDVPMRRVEKRRFRALGQPVMLFLDGKLDAAALWSSYVEEVKKGQEAQRMDFGADAGGGAGAQDAAPAPEDNAALAVIGARFSSLAECAKAEVAKNPKFAGVTLAFRWTPSGRAEAVAPIEPALRGGTLAACLGRVMETIQLPRFAGAPRDIQYPIRVK